MAGINKVIIIGHLGADPDMRYTPNGNATCELRVATSESWKDKEGKRQERTEWHRIVVWGRTAEACAKYLAKGRQVYVEGRIQTRTFDDKQGQKRYVTEVVANDVQFLGGGKSDGARDGSSRRDDAPPPADDFGGGPSGGYGGASPDDDIPFLTCDIGREPSDVAPILRRTT